MGSSLVGLRCKNGNPNFNTIIRNIRAGTIVGLCVVVLSSLEPGMHQSESSPLSRLLDFQS
jgi:hypothetical protein